jgi:parallel beta-helix repeat protein
MRMAITKVVCCFIAIAVLMNAMLVSVLAVNSNNASNSVSNHLDSSVSLCSNVIYVPDAKDHVFEVTADYLDIGGFTVEGAKWKAGIHLIPVDHCSVINNYVSNNYNNGITLMYPSGNMVSTNSPIELGNYTLILHATDERGNRASLKQCNITAVSSPGSAVFDTGEETYTYSCKGTDGYFEYVKIGNSTWKSIEAYFLGGEITRREFEDTRGHLNNCWIPAINLKEV